MRNILKIRDKNGNFIGIPAISGADGKSAYQSALDGGFIGTEEEFNQALAELMPNTEHTENKENPHGVTAEQVGALPITGGILKGNLFIGDNEEKSLNFLYSGNGEAFIAIRKDGANTGLLLSSEKNVDIADILKIVLKDGTEYAIYGEHNKPTASDVGAVDKKGDTMTGALTIQKHSPYEQIVMITPDAGQAISIGASDNVLQFIVRANTDPVTSRYLEIYSNVRENDVNHAIKLYQDNGNEVKEYSVLHTGSKPSGSYTGTGSSQERQIQIGGIGSVLMITSANKTIAFVWASGARYISSSSTSSFSSTSNATFANGVLTLKTATGALNSNGVTYNYQVL